MQKHHRCDLALALQTSSKPIFFTPDNVPWKLASAREAVLPLHEMKITNDFQIDTQIFLDGLDSQLAAVWTAMSQFCSLVNDAVERDMHLIVDQVFLSSMGSIMYRLLHFRFKAGSLDETVRLALVAFCSPIFLQWQNIKLVDPSLAHNYRKSLAGLNALRCGATPGAFLWLMMIGGTSIFHEPDDIAWLKTWLRRTIKLCSISSWDQMRDILNSFLWIGLIYDKPGQDFFKNCVH
ncbi:hypothetical protein NA57DRAFT_62068 [Rhizodiscina lignyota]|uniref:Uncharacterized protein n=1 Tax=Rhizodiscina lignyota TaxID=1504668 RepID=A0A9P4LZU9_9PEZI|nr:hypothetical protein NA57DRAFT_62068 [Rhizodiscina lignyota]